MPLALSTVAFLLNHLYVHRNGVYLKKRQFTIPLEMPFYLLSAHFSDESYNSSEVLSIYSHLLPSVESSLTMLSLPLPS